MTTKLRFDATQVRRLIEHAKGSKTHRAIYGQGPRPGPGLLFVKDEGIYLMSNGHPAQMPFEDQTTGSLAVVYAEGFDPGKRDRMDVWDDARAAVGGDDFGEFFDIAGVERCMRPEDVTLTIEVSETQLRLYGSGPIARAH